MRLHLSAICVLALMTVTAVCPLTGSCQTAPAANAVPSLAALPADLSAIGVPQTLTLSDLTQANPGWVRFHLAQGGGDTIESYFAQVASSYERGAQDDHYYTSGQEIDIAGDSHLVAYQLASAPEDYMKDFQATHSAIPKPPPLLTADTKLTLILLNLRTATGLVDIEPFSLQAVLTESKDRYTQAMKTIALEFRQENQAPAQSNAKQLMLGMIQYSQDYNEVMPPTTSAAAFKKAVYPYVKSESTFLDPVTGRTFHYNPKLSKLPLSKIKVPNTAIVLYTDQPDSQGNRVVGYADGHVKSISESTYQMQKNAEHIR